ncbi:hypothetical protein VSU16_02535 [Cetobacterium somerae]|uniref:hypothetical protein n=1 Tax=Cetobacterium somerae TaxID=188913 RepID=UPI002E7B71B5|nr:hypothetical protein [Cetobacterium somerae]WVJ01619.1 hypothetical protein VSU16_02535 [Cetobacterium somerae]
MKMKELNINYEQELSKLNTSNKRKVFEKLSLAALGAIPWVGGVISAMASIPIENKDEISNDLRTEWLKEHEFKLLALKNSLEEIVTRISNFGEEIIERIESPEYLQLVNLSYRIWDESATEEKRKFITNLLINSSGTKLCSDDVIRLFIDWIKNYHELHFKIISLIYKIPYINRAEIWRNLSENLEPPREDSAEADLFKMIIRDLSMGGVIRQYKPTDYNGNFLKTKKQAVTRTPLAKSAFDSSEPYEITNLGRQFVHYTMNENVSRIEEKN